jgi:AcrR family transcriptional regulator
MGKEKKALGRRPGKSGAQSAILRSAQKLFAEKSYDRTTIRDIATQAGVDPALVIHYFRTKQELFLAAMMPLAKAPKLLPGALEGDRDEVGLRFARLVVQLLEDGETPQFLTAMIRAAVSEPKAAEMVRNFVGPNLIRPLAKNMRHSDAELRAALIGAQMVGIITVKYIVRAEPLASATPAEIEKVLAPLIQKYFD